MAYYPFAPEKGAVYRLYNPANGATAVFNDPTDPNYVGMVSDISGLDSPEVRESAEDLVQADGGTHGNFYFGRRPVVMTAQIYGHATTAERTARIAKVVQAATALRSDATLSWEPAIRKENLVFNPSFEVDTAGWALSGGTLVSPTWARVTDWASSGTASIQMSATQPNDASIRIFGVVTPSLGSSAYAIPARPNVSYTATAEANVITSTASGTRISLIFYDAAGVNVGAITGGVQAGTGLKSFSISGVSPAGTATARIQLEVRFTVANESGSVKFDSVRLFETSQAGTYFDGTTAGYHWQGDPHVSQSGDFIEMFTPVRLNGRIQQTGGWNKELQIPLVSEYATVQSTGLKTLTGAGAASIVTENRGSWPAKPILRVTGPTAMNFTITNSTPNPDLVLRTTNSLIVAAGETLEIDTLNRTANFIAGARNGQNGNRFIDYGLTTWPVMATGNNTYVLSGTGTLAVLWRDTWA